LDTLIIKWSEYVTSAVSPEGYPNSDLPEIAVVGRSNVGKSSIINFLLNRKNLARVGEIPGKTRQINFFNAENKLMLVDLPGYGYARVSKTEKERWRKTIESYLLGRTQLRLIIMVLDIRHKPTEDDKLMYNWICTMGKPHIVLANKSDKISRAYLSGNINQIRETLDIVPGVPVIAVSSKKRTGWNETWDCISEMIPGLIKI